MEVAHLAHARRPGRPDGLTDAALDAKLGEPTVRKATEYTFCRYCNRHPEYMSRCAGTQSRHPTTAGGIRASSAHPPQFELWQMRRRGADALNAPRARE